MKNNVRKLFTLSFVIMLIVLSGCSIKLLPPLIEKETECSEREELTFFHLWPRGDDNYPLILRFINDFNNSKIANEIGVCVKGSGINFWDYWSKVDNAIYGGKSPDIYLHELSQTRYRVTNLLDLTSMVDYDIKNKIDTIHPNDVFYSQQLQVATIDNKLYSLPWSSTVRVIYYNKNLFNSVGLTDADLPTTWDELEEVSDRLTTVEENGDFKTIGFDPFAGEGQHFHQWVWLNGGDFWDLDENNKLSPNFNSVDKVNTMNRLLNFPNRQERDKLVKFMSQFAISGGDPFVSGKIGMIIGNEGTYFNLVKAGVNFEYGVIPLPAGPNKEDGISVNWSSSFDIELYDNHNRNHLTDEQAELRNRGSWEFLKYLFSKDIQKQMFETSPFLLSHREYLSEFSQGNDVLTVLATEIQHSKEISYVPMVPSWTSVINGEIQEIYKGTRTAEVGLGRIQDDMTRKTELYCSINPNSWGC